MIASYVLYHSNKHILDDIISILFMPNHFKSISVDTGIPTPYQNIQCTSVTRFDATY